jgi:NAD(P)-dependent dehydrogenase (short-subunit alcohol dehydrogenase family)
VSDRFADKVVAVTGGASGIGEALSRLIVTEGGHVVIIDLQADRGERLAAELGDDALFTRADVGSDEAMGAAIDAGVDRFGRLDVMCNNAGLVGIDKSIVDLTVADYEATLSVLLLGVLLGTKHAARVMIEQGNGGSIVNTSSIAGVQGGLGPHLYTTAKHAVVGLTRSTASELVRHRIRVNCVAPGGVPTPMAAAMVTGDPDKTDVIAARIAERSPLGRSSSPNDIAEAIAWFASDASGWVTGQTLVVDAGGLMAPPRTPAG